ncbi:unnamed protein product [Gordionus sp. m RMFG-2023]|uniref:uncharacterized protein LOC135931715 isoform X2 n=1 Tax=Gordionus sp. m RMFG-2023 TaxID=3053472 RepID=UPI0030DEFC53
MRTRSSNYGSIPSLIEENVKAPQKFALDDPKKISYKKVDSSAERKCNTLHVVTNEELPKKVFNNHISSSASSSKKGQKLLQPFKKNLLKNNSPKVGKDFDLFKRGNKKKNLSTSFDGNFRKKSTKFRNNFANKSLNSMMDDDEAPEVVSFSKATKDVQFRDRAIKKQLDKVREDAKAKRRLGQELYMAQKMAKQKQSIDEDERRISPAILKEMEELMNAQHRIDKNKEISKPSKNAKNDSDGDSYRRERKVPLDKLYMREEILNKRHDGDGQSQDKMLGLEDLMYFSEEEESENKVIKIVKLRQPEIEIAPIPMDILEYRRSRLLQPTGTNMSRESMHSLMAFKMKQKIGGLDRMVTC